MLSVVVVEVEEGGSLTTVVQAEREPSVKISRPRKVIFMGPTSHALPGVRQYLVCIAAIGDRYARVKRPLFIRRSVRFRGASGIAESYGPLINEVLAGAAKRAEFLEIPGVCPGTPASSGASQRSICTTLSNIPSAPGETSCGRLRRNPRHASSRTRRPLGWRPAF